jgi:hypothetical protein
MLCNKPVWSKNTVEWIDGNTAFVSVPFTWNLLKAFPLCAALKQEGYHVRAGGPAVSLMPDILATVAEIGGDADAVGRHNPDVIPIMLLILIMGILIGWEGKKWGFQGDPSFLSGYLIAFGILGILYFSFINNISRFIVKRTVKRTYGKNKYMDTGTRKISGSSEGIHTTTTLSDATIKWKAFENVANTNNHLFLIIPPNKAIIIPKTAFVDDSA